MANSMYVGLRMALSSRWVIMFTCVFEIAQLVEHCISIPQVMGSNPIQAHEFFSGFNFTAA